ncbi:YbaB/EbfC family nucleoid-associated protein [Streptomyces sp. NBC_01455]|uniref:YbaB/EbfC family nucleoid-associated protein n=1 Tax=Streptomyces sp. NBC_01455 TaxID=2903874 RepID=UPI002E2F76BD|nr:YbaB/EbfC family nucleoid-associated protein [Streptomyces sp. NBC_01455]
MTLDDGLGIGKLLESARRLQHSVAQAKDELGALTVQGTAGGGAVKATVSGKGGLEKLHISPVAADPGNTQALANLIVSAVRNAQENLIARHEERFLPMLESLSIDLQGLSGSR